MTADRQRASPLAAAVVAVLALAACEPDPPKSPKSPTRRARPAPVASVNEAPACPPGTTWDGSVCVARVDTSCPEGTSFLPGVGCLARMAASGAPDKRSRVCAVGEIEECAERCRRGEAASCNNLGLSYAAGVGVPKDDARAARFYDRACEGGSFVGCGNLGGSYASGAGVERNAVTAARLFKTGCDGGAAHACVNLAVALKDGDGIPKDTQLAQRLMRRGCDEEVPEGCYLLGLSMALSDKAGGQAAFGRGCKLGHLAACAFFGARMLTSDAEFRDVPRGIQVLISTCDSGGALGCAFLGRYYLATPGLRTDGLQLLRRACAGGDSESCSFVKAK